MQEKLKFYETIITTVKDWRVSVYMILDYFKNKDEI
jgi:hypothetical protein